MSLQLKDQLQTITGFLLKISIYLYIYIVVFLLLLTRKEQTNKKHSMPTQLLPGPLFQHRGQRLERVTPAALIEAQRPLV